MGLSTCRVQGVVFRVYVSITQVILRMGPSMHASVRSHYICAFMAARMLNLKCVRVIVRAGGRASDLRVLIHEDVVVQILSMFLPEVEHTRKQGGSHDCDGKDKVRLRPV